MQTAPSTPSSSFSWKDVLSKIAWIFGSAAMVGIILYRKHQELEKTVIEKRQELEKQIALLQQQQAAQQQRENGQTALAPLYSPPQQNDTEPLPEPVFVDSPVRSPRKTSAAHQVRPYAYEKLSATRRAAIARSKVFMEDKVRYKEEEEDAEERVDGTDACAPVPDDAALATTACTSQSHAEFSSEGVQNTGADEDPASPLVTKRMAKRTLKQSPEKSDIGGEIIAPVPAAATTAAGNTAASQPSVTESVQRRDQIFFCMLNRLTHHQELM